MAAPAHLLPQPAGWRGVCGVRQTVRKTYMIR